MLRCVLVTACYESNHSGCSVLVRWRHLQTAAIWADEEMAWLIASAVGGC